MIHRVAGYENSLKCVVLLRDSEEKILMFKSNDEWSFPTEVVSIGDTPINTFTKITQEQLGLSIYNVKFLFSYFNEPYIDLVFNAGRFRGDLVVPSNVTEYKWEYTWFLANYNLTDETRKTLDEYDAKYIT